MSRPHIFVGCLGLAIVPTWPPGSQYARVEDRRQARSGSPGYGSPNGPRATHEGSEPAATRPAPGAAARVTGGLPTCPPGDVARVAVSPRVGVVAHDERHRSPTNLSHFFSGLVPGILAAGRLAAHGDSSRLSADDIFHEDRKRANMRLL